MATSKKEHTCSMGSKFVEIDGKIKGNNELTLLKMTQIEKDIKSLSDMMQSFIEKADDKYVSRTEHEINAEKIKGLEYNQAKIAWFIILGVVGAVLSLILK